MVERLIAAALLAAPALAGAALAQGPLADPTRPPNAAPQQGTAGPAADAPAQRLQSVLISPHRRLAVIDGRTVPLGGKVGDATLVQVDETQVTLRGSTGTRVLPLTPGVVRQAPADMKKKNKEKP